MDAPIHLGAEFVDDPYALYERLREEGPVRKAILPRGLRVWLVTRYDQVRDALADPRLHNDIRIARANIARNRPAGGSSRNHLPDQLTMHMLNSDPPDHSRLRAFCPAMDVSGSSVSCSSC